MPIALGMIAMIAIVLSTQGIYKKSIHRIPAARCIAPDVSILILLHLSTLTFVTHAEERTLG
jgi:hypothetical protein